MNENFISQFCEYIYSLLKVPVCHYVDNIKSSYFSSSPSEYQLMIPYEEILLSSQDNISYLITEQYLYYGMIKVKNSKSSIIIGPISSTRPSDYILKSILSDTNINISDIESYKYFFNSIPIISFDKFLQILCFLNFTFNKENLTIEQIFDYRNLKYEVTISKSYTDTSYETKENENFHNTYQFEQLYLSYVEKGDLSNLKNLILATFNLNAGIIADNNIRQAKNIFITAATLITRASIRGGLEIETAYQLSDTYIQQMEYIDDIKLIYNLQYQMVIDFIERVRDSKISVDVSNVIYRCIQYISSNVNKLISVSQVAEHVQRSRSFISRTFKAEMGIDLSAYIMKRKLEEAESLLKFSDKSISEISNYLCFSSQSYFQNVFKKNYEMTPNEYRKKYAR